MANTCHTELTVSGQANDIKAFTAKMETKDELLDFSPFDVEDGFAWAFDVKRDAGTDHVVYEYWTKWGVPEEAMAAIAAAFPTLTFHVGFAVLEMDACGWQLYSGGVQVAESSRYLSWTEEMSKVSPAPTEDDEEENPDAFQDWLNSHESMVPQSCTWEMYLAHMADKLHEPA